MKIGSDNIRGRVLKLSKSDSQINLIRVSKISWICTIPHSPQIMSPNLRLKRQTQSFPVEMTSWRAYIEIQNMFLRDKVICF